MGEDFSKYIDKKIFKVVSEVCNENGLSSFVIGGYVRDLILKRPSKDIDIVVLGSGLDLAEKVAEKLGIEKVQYFKTFGTAMFLYEGDDVEFVGARKESYQRDSRKPIVEDGTLEDDQKRRDFVLS